MKKRFTYLFMLLLVLSGCQQYHTGKVVVDENKEAEESINVEYVIVDEADKDTLIKNIKEGKGAVINKNKNTDLDNTNNQNNQDNNANSENR